MLKVRVSLFLWCDAAVSIYRPILRNVACFLPSSTIEHRHTLQLLTQTRSSGSRPLTCIPRADSTQLWKLKMLDVADGRQQQHLKIVLVTIIICRQSRVWSTVVRKHAHKHSVEGATSVRRVGKKRRHRIMTIFLSKLNRYRKCFTERFLGKFAAKRILNIPPHLAYVATLPRASKKIKSVNIWQSCRQERDCLVHFLRLLAVCWPGAVCTTRA